jgi:hypothetical protein
MGSAVRTDDVPFSESPPKKANHHSFLRQPGYAQPRKRAVHPERAYSPLLE